jgi:hypothetical protein
MSSQRAKPRNRRRSHTAPKPVRATTARPAPQAPQRRWPIATACALAMFVAFIAWRFRHDPTPAMAHSEPSSPPISSVQPAQPGPRALARAQPTPQAPAAPLVPYAELGHDGISTDDPLTAYRKQNIYPPASRPLTAEHVDLLHPNQRHEQRRPTDHDDGVEFLLTADRYFVIGDETIAVTLDVTRDGKPLDVAIADAFVATADQQRYPLVFARRDATNLATFAPTILRAQRQTTATVYVDFEYGDTHQRSHFDFQYTPASGIPARFTGTFREGVENGSLVVHAGLAVERAGYYLVDCNLFDERDRPIAWTRAKLDLAAGKHDVPLVFFGKVLVDQGASGPLHIGQLRGARFDEGRDPDLEQIPPFTGTFATRYYRTIAFSDAEYDSPEKQKMLRFLADEKSRGVHQGAATPVRR